MNEEVVRRIGEQRLGEWRVQEAGSPEHARTLAISLSPSRIATISLRRSNSCSNWPALVQMILFIAGIGLVIAGILASMIVMLMRDHENDTHIDTEQKAPLSAEPAGPRASLG